MVRVLLLNLYYPPDTSATAKVAKTVVGAIAEKHDVTILSGRPSYDPTERRAWRLYQTEESGNIRVIRVGSTDYPRVQMNRRVFNYLTYVLLAVPRALLLRCDVILAMTDPPFEGIVGAFVAMLKNKPYVYDIQDMYPDMAVGGSIVKPGLLSRIWEKLHRWAMKRATRVIVIGEDMRNRILAKGVDAERIAVVRSGVEISGEGSDVRLDESVVEAIRQEFRFVLLHAGNLGFYGAWDTLLEGARLLGPDGVGLVFVGDGAQRERLERASSGIPNVRFLPFFPASKIPSVLAAADAHVITVKRGLEGVVVPSKMYGILAAGKPIVARGAGGMRCSVHRRAARALRFRPIRTMRRCSRNGYGSIATDPERLRKMGDAALRVAPEYEQKRELRKLVEVLEESVR